MNDRELTRNKLIKACSTDPEQVADLVLQLLDRIDKHEARIVELEARLNQDSHNSSLPPSSDKFGKRYPDTLHPKSKRSPGGQKGHRGSTLKRVKEPHIVVDHRVAECQHCGTSLTDTPSIQYRARQVVDIPVITMIVTEHRAEVKTSACCNKTSHAEFPEGVTQAVQYGPEIKGAGVYLMEHQMLSSKRTVEALEDLFNCSIAEGSLFNWTIEAADVTAGTYEEIKECAIQSEVLSMDETAVNRDEDRQWVHVACTPELTYLAFHTGRGCEAMNAIGILPNFDGCGIHDMYASYFTYDFEHGVCNAHILRELTLAFEEYKQAWAEAMIRLLQKALRTVKSCIRKGRDSVDPRTLLKYEERFTSLVNEGLKQNPLAVRGSPHTRGKVKQSKVRNLLDRLDKHREHVLAFLYEFAIPFTNNEAERDLRVLKVKLKISGCFRSVAGLDVYCRLRSYLSTARKNGVRAFKALRDAFQGRPFKLQRC